ncbi:hypothetical protein NBRC10512_000347 [Rhodotorula toruloides]|uniref:RHTO0S26e01442g1_1 n=2 Tax=Rhodotorula toruloides TaxID=5286 RepID=A0A061BHH9_RHOTO|nr:oxoglutarate/iron-dependent oxygenase [Rhodotorula toruloides NP11]EMS21299.1 oxoglutarate/iron-dependent oxygenase [Rhodotorula toruloides NP11]CDR49423.1 RHTO0S26e01442g1_1 [Rhodotorula toruloides]
MQTARNAPKLRLLTRSCHRCSSTLRTAQTPHPALTVYSNYLSAAEQSLLLKSSLRLLDSPSRTTSAGRKRRREWVKANPEWDGRGFMADEAYAWEEGHFDGVIKQYREMLVRDGMWEKVAAGDEKAGLAEALEKVYSLLPPSEPPSQPSSSSSPPPHLIMHLLHLSSRGAIYPHVDNLEAFGRTIVGISLGGERIMRFKQVSEPREGTAKDGPSEFEVLLEAGSAYVQAEPLRTHYTHEVLEKGEWEGRTVGGTQRLSIMLRDRLPTKPGHMQV